MPHGTIGVIFPYYIMAKTKQNKRKRALVVRSRAKPQVPRNVPGGPEARRYMDMLLDPCRAELDYAPYPGTKLDFVQRKRAQSVLDANAYQVFFHHPTLGTFGYSGSNDGFALGLSFNVALSPFIDSNYKSLKPIAGCFSVEWIGAESARQGWINAGIVTGDFIANSLPYADAVTLYSINSWARSATFTERMPIDKFELNWVPGPKDAISPTPYVGDQTGTDSASRAFWKTELEGRNFIMVVLSGIGAGTNVITTVTDIGEVAQAASVNVTSNAAVVFKPKFDYTTVLSTLQAKDTSWYVNTFKKLGKLAAGMLGAYTGGGLPGILGYLTMGSDSTTQASNKNLRS